MKRHCRKLTAAILLIGLFSIIGSEGARADDSALNDPTEGAIEKIRENFDHDIRPIFATSCMACHDSQAKPRSKIPGLEGYEKLYIRNASKKIDFSREFPDWSDSPSPGSAVFYLDDIEAHLHAGPLSTKKMPPQDAWIMGASLKDSDREIILDWVNKSKTLLASVAPAQPIAPKIFTDRCLACHNTSTPSGGFSIQTTGSDGVSFSSGNVPGTTIPYFSPGAPLNSAIYLVLLSDADRPKGLPHMPEVGDPFTPEEQQGVFDWIQQQDLGTAHRIQANRAPQGVVDSAFPTDEASRLSGELQTTLENAHNYILSKRNDQGYWVEPMDGDVSIDALVLALGKKLGKLTPETTQTITQDILSRLDERGGWVAYPGGPIDSSVTAITLLSLQQAGGIGRDDARLKLAWDGFDHNGGINNLELYSKTFLSLVDLLPAGSALAITPKFLGLSDKAPVNVDKLGIVGEITVPVIALSYLDNQSDESLLMDRKSIDTWMAEKDLIGDPKEADKTRRRNCVLPEAEGDLQSLLNEIQSNPGKYENCIFRSPNNGKKTPLTRLLHIFKKSPTKVAMAGINFVLDRAVPGSKDFWVEQAVARVLENQSEQGDWYSNLTSIGALRLLQAAQRTGLGDFQDEIDRGWQALLRSRTLSEDGYRAAQFMSSGVWDTASSLESFAPLRGTKQELSSEDSQKTVTWLLQEAIEGKTSSGDRSVSWSFDETTRQADVDTTSYVIHSLVDSAQAKDPATVQAIQGGLSWILAQQNDDGGFAVWQKNGRISPLVGKAYKLLFSGQNLPYQDVSQSDVTGRVLTMLAGAESVVAGDQKAAVKAAEQKACHYLGTAMPKVQGLPVRLQQGMWMSNYVYSAAANLSGLSSAGCYSDVQAGLARWMSDVQQSDGGWGESNESYAAETYVPAPPTLSQSAIALIGLEFYYERLKNLGQEPPAWLKQSIENGVQFIMKKTEDGNNFKEKEFTGIILKGMLYCRYELVPAYTSLFVLGRWQQLSGTHL